MVDRKKFLLVFASSAIGLFLTACFSKIGQGSKSLNILTESSSLLSGETGNPPEQEKQSAAAETSDVSKTGNSKQEEDKKIKKARVGISLSEESIEKKINKAVELAGGLGFIKKDSVVLLKPNLNTGDPNPASTNPEVVRHVIRLVKKQNPSAILVGDRSSFWTDTVSCMKKNGVYAVAGEEGAELYPFEADEWIRIKPELAQNWKSGFTIPRGINLVDYIISLPVIKTHSIATFTMAIKNWVGILQPKERTADLHMYNNKKDIFGYKLAELHLARVPDFIVMDGTRVFVDGGPTEGTAVDANIIVASDDIIANDVCGLAILKSLGTNKKIQDRSVWDHPQIARAVELGLGIKERENIEINSDNSFNAGRIISNLV